MLTGALLKAGLPPEVVEMLRGDTAVHLAVEQGLFLLAGVATAGVAALWRSAAKHFGWKT